MTVTEQHIEPQLIPILEQVSDPEIPVLSIMDMGVVRTAIIENNIVKVQITPTYSGCPAMDVIGDDIKSALKSAGFNSEIELILAPAWTTDWITSRGRKALEDYGIAAPLDTEADKSVLLECQQRGFRASCLWICARHGDFGDIAEVSAHACARCRP